MSRTRLCRLPVENHRLSPATRTDRARSFPCTSTGLKRKTKKLRRGGKEMLMEYLSLCVAAGLLLGKLTGTNLITDWFVFGHGRGFSCRDLPKPAAERAGQLVVLSRDHHPDLGHHRFQRIANDFAAPSAPQSERV